MEQYSELYNSWIMFKKSKKPSRAIDEFAYRLERNLAQLTDEIASRTYKHSGYRRIVVEEKKRRDLAVADVRDRVMHRLVYNRLVDKYDKTFDSDVWSCRTGKGLHKGLARVQQLLQRYGSSYVWRADIAKFFDTVDHQVLKAQLQRKLAKDNQIMYLCNQIIESYNLASQPASQPASQRYPDWKLDKPNFCQHLLA